MEAIMQFSGKTVIITGAGKGIGRACAELMAARGAEVSSARSPKYWPSPGEGEG